MSYGTPTGVAGLVRNILSGAVDFSNSSSPALNQVEEWLSSGCSIIEARLSSAGYATPAAESSGIWGWLADLNNLWGASKVEFSRTIATVGPGERTRGQIFEQQFWQGLDRLCNLDLTLIGLSRVSDDAIYVGGTKDSEKDEWEQSTDRVKPRFFKGQFAFDETIRPNDDTSASAY